jgi:hypothetical protein
MIEDQIEIVEQFDGNFKMKVQNYTFSVWGKRIEDIGFHISWDEHPHDIASKLNVDADELSEAVENAMLRRLPPCRCSYDF